MSTTTEQCAHCGTLTGKELCTVAADVCPYKTEPHGFADLVAIVKCECGTEFVGYHEAEALALWSEHANEAEQ